MSKNIELQDNWVVVRGIGNNKEKGELNDVSIYIGKTEKEAVTYLHKARPGVKQYSPRYCNEFLRAIEYQRTLRKQTDGGNKGHYIFGPIDANKLKSIFTIIKNVDEILEKGK